LVSVLAAQTGVAGAVGFLGFLAVVSMACWIVGRWAGPQASSKSKVVALLVGFGLSVAGGMQFLHLDFAEADCAPTEVISIDDLDFSTDIPWQPFSEQRVKDLAGQTVFVDFTADWCLTCKANEKAVLNTEAVREAMAAHKVVPLMADWTRMDPEISAWLRRFGRAGVPFYLVIPAERSKPWVPLPEVITKSIVIDGIVKASD
jgi:thiol:disulfide interchange protein